MRGASDPAALPAHPPQGDKARDLQPRADEQLHKFACLTCRRVFKRRVTGTGRRNHARPIDVRVCPSCGGEAFLMGANFRAPPRADKAAWRVVEMLVRAGFAYANFYVPLSLSRLGHPKTRYPAILSASSKVCRFPTDLAGARAFIERYRAFAQPIVRRGDSPPGG